MTDERECPKCGGTMNLGILQKRGQYGNSPFIWAPIDEPPFPLKDPSSHRYEIDIFRCKGCGFVEFYAERPA
ncbi:MAG: hypothetical protein FJ150_07510 [Euryarchaeota archaeon]|nr:hypothetical protein [Euryarchaeota archaeon]